MSDPGRRQRGIIGILLVLTFSVLIGAAVLSGSNATKPLLREAYRTKSSDAALALAEAGVELARAKLASDPSWTGAQDLPLGKGTLTVRVTRQASGLLRVESEGSVAAATQAGKVVLKKRLRVTLERTSGRTTLVSWDER